MEPNPDNEANSTNARIEKIMAEAGLAKPAAPLPIRIDDPLLNWSIPAAWYAAFTAVAAVVLLAPILGRWCTLSPDSIAYFSAARSLIETGRFPPEFLMRPPGFPTLLAPLFLQGDLPLFGVRLLFAICFVASGVLTFYLFRRELGSLPALLAALLVVTNTVLMVQSTVALSEMVYLPIQLGALMLLMRVQRAPQIGPRLLIVAGVMTSASIMVRTIGIALLPIGLLAIALRPREPVRRKLTNAAVFLVAALTVSVAWQIRQAAYPDAYGYRQMVSRAMAAENTNATGLALHLERLRRFGPLRLEGIKEAMVPNRIGWRVFQSIWDRPTTIFVGLFFILLALTRAVRLRSVPDAYALVVLCILALWPWDEGVRLVVPLVPIFAGGGAWLVAVLIKACKNRAKKIVVAAVLVGLGVHVMEVLALHRQIPKLQKKAEHRLAEMKAFSQVLQASVPSNETVLSVVRNGSNVKLTISGGGYLARRTIRYIDLILGQPLDWESISENYAAVDKDGLIRIANRAHVAVLGRQGNASLISFSKSN